MSVEKTARNVIRRETADREHKQQSHEQAGEAHDVQKNGRDRFSLSRPSYKPNLYGSVSFQALRPCVAAYSSREPGTMVSPATSTIGSPLPAVAQLVEPFASIITPKSLET